jgi:DNA-binding transcriptional regulator LsrR (DeoR family)
MKVYTKSVPQYKKERERRKEAWSLYAQGVRTKIIAEKLGVSQRTVERDINKRLPYYMGLVNRQIRLAQAERNRELQERANRMTLEERFRLYTRMAKNVQYKRKLEKALIFTFDMDTQRSDGLPALTVNKTGHMTFRKEIDLVFNCVRDGQTHSLGGVKWTVTN